MREVATGVWQWRAAHPEWKPGQTWDRMVSSYAVDTEEGVLLFDPLDVPAELDRHEVDARVDPDDELRALALDLGREPVGERLRGDGHRAER